MSKRDTAKGDAPKAPKRPNGLGTVTERASGNFQAKWVGPDRVRRSRTFRTRGAAQDWLDEVRTDVRRGDWLPPEPAAESVADYVLRWINESAPRLKASTLAQHKWVHKRYVAPDLSGVTLAKITPAAVRTWHATISETFGPGAAANAYRVVRAAMSTAVADGAIKANPCRVRGGGSTPSRPARVVTPGEVAAVADAVPARYRALVLVLAWGGLRSGEAFALRPENVDGARVRIVERRYRHADGVVSVDTPKSSAGVRTVDLPATVAQVLKDHMETYPGPLVFTTRTGRPVTSNGARVVFANAAARAGVTPFRVHDLRSTAATVAVQSGATTREVMARLGHASPATAMLYQRATEERGAALAAAMDEVIVSGANVVPLRRRTA